MKPALSLLSETNRYSKRVSVPIKGKTDLNDDY